MKLIDRNAVLNRYQEICMGVACMDCPFKKEDGCAVEKLILDSAVVDAEPVKHGRWIKDGEASALYKCSICGTLCSLVGYANCIPIEQMNKTMKYCNSCGAKMDGKGEES